MDKAKLIKYWQEGSALDFASAKDIIEKTKRYTHAAFFLHLSVEKNLKAKYIERHGKHAPFSHNLLFLAREASINLSDVQEKLLSEVNEFNLEATYPDDIMALQAKINNEFIQKYLQQVEEFLKWISQN